MVFAVTLLWGWHWFFFVLLRKVFGVKVNLRRPYLSVPQGCCYFLLSYCPSNQTFGAKRIQRLCFWRFHPLWPPCFQARLWWNVRTTRARIRDVPATLERNAGTRTADPAIRSSTTGRLAKHTFASVRSVGGGSERNACWWRVMMKWDECLLVGFPSFGSLHKSTMRKESCSERSENLVKQALVFNTERPIATQSFLTLG